MFWETKFEDHHFRIHWKKASLYSSGCCLAERARNSSPSMRDWVYWFRENVSWVSNFFLPLFMLMPFITRLFLFPFLFLAYFLSFSRQNILIQSRCHQESMFSSVSFSGANTTGRVIVGGVTSGVEAIGAVTAGVGETGEACVGAGAAARDAAVAAAIAEA